MKIRLAVISIVALSGSVACSSEPPVENSAAVVQRIESTCEHAICATGEGLDATCDPCATLLCAQDPYCCNSAWDATCVGEVASICNQSCTAKPPPSEAGPSTCAHASCATGAALASDCEPCVAQLCALDPYCCGVEWDATCVGEVGAICGKSCN
jgi:hypothetical protein